MSGRITVVDYGAGNLLNVVRALQHVGAEVEVTQSPQAVAGAQKLVLPGVGAFGDCMQALGALGLVAPLRDYLRAGRPFLGICVGMQVLFEVGEEFGEHAGLGVLSGRVARIPAQGADGKPHKIPHIGWAALKPAEAGAGWAATPLAGHEGSQPAMYFVHSYQCVPAQRAEVLAEVEYNGLPICAAVARGQVFGVQFHPEKSAEAGLGLLRQFLAL
jgi:glutamine amidotransferase